MIVLTAGTFDTLHAGHVELLRVNRKLSLHGRDTCAVVGVNTDDFVEQFKGRKPAQSLDERIQVLKSIRYVDKVVVNEGREDLKPMLETIMPDVLTIGDDWAKKDYYKQIQASVEWMRSRNIELLYIPRTTGVSSTAIREWNLI